jgi:hypothetical protein
VRLALLTFNKPIELHTKMSALLKLEYLTYGNSNKKEDEDFVMAATLNGEKPVIIRKPIPIEDLVKE